jgi:hypothetical protein
MTLRLQDRVCGALGLLFAVGAVLALLLGVSAVARSSWVLVIVCVGMAFLYSVLGYAYLAHAKGSLEIAGSVIRRTGPLGWSLGDADIVNADVVSTSRGRSMLSIVMTDSANQRPSIRRAIRLSHFAAGVPASASILVPLVSDSVPVVTSWVEARRPTR